VRSLAIWSSLRNDVYNVMTAGGGVCGQSLFNAPYTCEGERALAEPGGVSDVGEKFVAHSIGRHERERDHCQAPQRSTHGDFPSEQRAQSGDLL